MGLRDRLRSLKLLLTDPNAYNEMHSSRMNEAFAERLAEEKRAKAATPATRQPDGPTGPS
jgi:hypothetical protein